jgi:hypothetical protein
MEFLIELRIFRYEHVTPPGGFCDLGFTYCYEHVIRQGEFINIKIFL